MAFLFLRLMSVMMIFGLKGTSAGEDSVMDILSDPLPTNSTNTSSIAQTPAPPMDAIKLMGRFNNTKFYYSSETSVSMSRSEAKDYCEKNGMQLVSINSDEEFKFLGSTLPRRRFWTSGISINRFMWDGVKRSLISRPVHVFNRINCVVLFWSVSNEANLYGDPCDGSHASGYHPLCETLEVKEV